VSLQGREKKNNMRTGGDAYIRSKGRKIEGGD